MRRRRTVGVFVGALLVAALAYGATLEVRHVLAQPHTLWVNLADGSLQIPGRGVAEVDFVVIGGAGQAGQDVTSRGVTAPGGRGGAGARLAFSTRGYHAWDGGDLIWLQKIPAPSAGGDPGTAEGGRGGAGGVAMAVLIRHMSRRTGDVVLAIAGAGGGGGGAAIRSGIATAGSAGGDAGQPGRGVGSTGIAIGGGPPPPCPMTSNAVQYLPPGGTLIQQGSRGQAALDPVATGGGGGGQGCTGGGGGSGGGGGGGSSYVGADAFAPRIDSVVSAAPDVSIGIENRGFSPQFLSPDHATFKVGEEGRFEVITFGSPPAGSPTLKGGFPAGIRFSSLVFTGNARLEGRPQPGSEGVYPVDITIRNEWGSAHQTLTVTVLP